MVSGEKRKKSRSSPPPRSPAPLLLLDPAKEHRPSPRRLGRRLASRHSSRSGDGAEQLLLLALNLLDAACRALRAQRLIIMRASAAIQARDATDTASAHRTACVATVVDVADHTFSWASDDGVVGTTIDIFHFII